MLEIIAENLVLFKVQYSCTCSQHLQIKTYFLYLFTFCVQAFFCRLFASSSVLPSLSPLFSNISLSWFRKTSKPGVVDWLVALKVPLLRLPPFSLLLQTSWVFFLLLIPAVVFSILFSSVINICRARKELLDFHGSEKAHV